VIAAAPKLHRLGPSLHHHQERGARRPALLPGGGCSSLGVPALPRFVDPTGAGDSFAGAWSAIWRLRTADCAPSQAGHDLWELVAVVLLRGFRLSRTTPGNPCDVERGSSSLRK